MEHQTDATAIPAPSCDDAQKSFFTSHNGRTFAGRHLIIEVIGGNGLDDPDVIGTALRDAAQAARATLLHLHLHRFSPQGVSGVAVLAESHISVHTWPEAGYGAFDVFMCGDADPWQAVRVLRAAFAADRVEVKELLRGEGLL